jgi:DNA-binding MarR family transcriptional regulator
VPWNTSPADFRHKVIDAVRELILAGDGYRDAWATYFGISETDMAAIGQVYSYGGLGQTELAQQLRITTSSTTALVDRLIANGFAQRVAHPSDRRRVTVRLTDKGQSALLISREWFVDVLKGIPDVDLVKLLEQITTISHALRHRADEVSAAVGSGQIARPTAGGQISPPTVPPTATGKPATANRKPAAATGKPASDAAKPRARRRD